MCRSNQDCRSICAGTVKVFQNQCIVRRIRMVVVKILLSTFLAGSCLIFSLFRAAIVLSFALGGHLQFIALCIKSMYEIAINDHASL